MISQSDASRRASPTEVVAGYLSAAAIFASLVGVVERPLRIIPVALLVALIAARLGGPNQRLHAVAIAIISVCWLVGMTIAVFASRPLY